MVAGAHQQETRPIFLSVRWLQCHVGMCDSLNDRRHPDVDGAWWLCRRAYLIAMLLLAVPTLAHAQVEQERALATRHTAQAFAPSSVAPAVVPAGSKPLDPPLESEVVMDTTTESARGRAAQGTHFLTELSLGAAFGGGSPGLTSLLRFGVGGKFVGFPLRFYLLGELAYAQHSDTVQQVGFASTFSHSRWGLALGVRVVAPVMGGLRLFVDGYGGTSLVQAELQSDLGSSVEVSGWEPTAALGVGLQLRVSRSASVGGTLRFVFTGEPLAGAAGSGSGSGPADTSVLAGAAWHF